MKKKIILLIHYRYPEIHVAQYPRGLGSKKKSGKRLSKSLALTLTADGRPDYSAIAKQGHAKDRVVQTSFQDLIPLRQRAAHGDVSLAKPSESAIEATRNKTQAAIQKIMEGKAAAAQPKGRKAQEPTYVRYTATARLGEEANQQRIIKMVDVQEDPLAPPKFKHRKVPARPPSPPAPVLRSPPRKLTAADQQAWYIPPSVSNWKNPKGFTIALDKRVAADGRNLQQPELNDNFAKLSEALAVADQKAREEIGLRAEMQRKMAQKETLEKEERLRELARKAREERERSMSTSGPNRARLERSESPRSEYSRSPSRSRSPSQSRSPSVSRDRDSSSRRNETRAERERREFLEDKRRAAERELRRSRMGREQRIRALARDQTRDVSERVALGLARPSASSKGGMGSIEAQFDSRLFGNTPSSAARFNEDQVYDSSLFSAREAVSAVYRPRVGAGEQEDEQEWERVAKERRFEALGSKRGETEQRDGPVEFEKDAGDPFGVGEMIQEVQRSKKYGLNKPGDDNNTQE